MPVGGIRNNLYGCHFMLHTKYSSNVPAEIKQGAETFSVSAPCAFKPVPRADKVPSKQQ